MIPVLDLSRKIARFRDQIDEATASVLDSGSLVLGRQVSIFEKQFADYLRVKECISVANGTDALELAMRAAGVNGKSRIITAANAGNYARTAANIIGAQVVYADVDIHSRNISVQSILPLLEAGADYVVATHLYGQAINEIREIAEICQKYGAILIEDCAQAHGAEVDGVKVGNFGLIACFSFYPTKNLGALGDGGAIVTNDSKVGEIARGLRTYGWSDKYTVRDAYGRNSRLDEIQASYLNIFLPALDADNARRVDIANHFNQASNNSSLEHPQFKEKDYVAHLYVVSVQNRSDAIEHFRANGIATAIHYPITDYDQPYLSSSGERANLPNTDLLTARVLTLPCFPEMTDSEVESVSAAISALRG